MQNWLSWPRFSDGEKKNTLPNTQTLSIFLLPHMSTLWPIEKWAFSPLWDWALKTKNLGPLRSYLSSPSNCYPLMLSILKTKIPLNQKITRMLNGNLTNGPKTSSIYRNSGVIAWPGATKDSIVKPKVHADPNIIGKLESMGWWKPKRKIILPETISMTLITDLWHITQLGSLKLSKWSDEGMLYPDWIAWHGMFQSDARFMLT